MISIGNNLYSIYKEIESVIETAILKNVKSEELYNKIESLDKKLIAPLNTVRERATLRSFIGYCNRKILTESVEFGYFDKNGNIYFSERKGVIDMLMRLYPHQSQMNELGRALYWKGSSNVFKIVKDIKK